MSTAVEYENLPRLFDELISASDQFELLQITRAIVNALGMQWFVFVSLHSDDDDVSRPTHRFLIGCKPEWCQLYNARKWFLTDPCLEYAKRNTAPAYGSDIVAVTRGQKEMLDAADVNGFRSRIVVPVHTSETGRIGVLYVGSDAPSYDGERVYRRNRIYFRSLASDLFDWSSKALRVEICAKHKVTSDDLDLISLYRRGFGASDIAAERQISTTTVYARFKKLNERLGMPNISASMKFAEKYGLVS